jgi:NAD(P)-dependent dehydrogenase (short-subunit alcohol dehydrogenase family)
MRAFPARPNRWIRLTRTNGRRSCRLTSTPLQREASGHRSPQEIAADSIIIISSPGGRYSYPNRSPYATSKWGLNGFTKTLPIELGEYGIRANAILPGAVTGAPH